MSRRLVLWRHGQTEWNLAGRGQGHIDVPLDDVGRQQARSAAARLASLKPSAIILRNYTSRPSAGMSPTMRT